MESSYVPRNERFLKDTLDDDIKLAGREASAP